MERSGTGRGTIGEVGMGWESLVEFRDRWGTLGEVRDGSEDTRGGLGRVGGPSEWFGTD